MSSDLFKRYAELQLQQKAIQSELDALKPEILANMPGQQCKVDGATFSIATRKNWQYSSEVKDLEAKLKDLQKHEQSKGVATFTETTYLTVRL